MQETFSLSQKFRQLVCILWPILITQVSMFAMNFFDTLMSGQASPYDLAGVAIGSSIWLPINTGLGGIFIAITPIVAQLLGANLKQEISSKVIQGLYLALVVAALIVFLGSFLLEPILSLMNLEVSVRSIARGYLKALACGIPPLFIYYVLRGFMDAIGKTSATMLIALSSLPINIFLNYIFIFGKFGLPAFGGVGAGIASTITYWCLAVFAFVMILRHDTFRGYEIFNSGFGLALKVWKELLKIGIPIAFSIFFETSIFAVVTLLMSNFNTYIIAAHQAAMNFASLLYMVPLSISMAMTILIGFEVGGKRLKDARQYSYLGIGISLSMAVVCGIILMLFQEQVAGLYTKENIVLNLIKQFLILALFFQMSDAIAAPIQGVLRGYKDVNVIFIMALISYWAIGLPLGYYLANFTSFGAKGFWIGLILGLAVNAMSLLTRLLIIQRRITEHKLGTIKYDCKRV